MSTDFVIGSPTPREDGFAFDVFVPNDLRYFEGHFPSDPIVPGVAQLVMVEEAVRRAFSDLDRPTSITRVKFSQRIGPGAELGLALTRSDDAIRFVLSDNAGSEVSRGSLRYASMRDDASGSGRTS